MKRVFLPIILFAVLCMGCEGVTVELPSQPLVDQGVVIPDKPHPESEPIQEVLFFTQRGCSPCEQVKPHVEELRKQGLKVTEVWHHEKPKMFRQYGVSSTPMFIILEDGVEIERTGDIVLLITILVKVLAWILPFLLG